MKKEKEEWRVLPFAQNYAVSDLGRVKRLTPRKRDFGYLVSPYLKGRSDRGWISVCLTFNGKEKSFRVHRLVMTCFRGPSVMSINHKNGVKSDNRLLNLEYVTPAQNTAHAVKLGLVNAKGVKNPNNRFSEEEIISMKKLLKDGVLQRVIAEKFKCHISQISLLNRGLSWAHIK